MTGADHLKSQQIAARHYFLQKLLHSMYQGHANVVKVCVVGMVHRPERVSVVQTIGYAAVEESLPWVPH